MARSQGPRQVYCYHCGHGFEVSSRAMSTSCPECNKPVVVEDIKVKSYQALNVLETCGRLVIPRKKRVVVQEHVVAHGGIQVDGTLTCARAVSLGAVVLGPMAVWEGDLRASSLAVHSGAVILGGHFSVPEVAKVP